MKFGVREICDVVFKAKAAQKVGNKMFFKDEPVIYFDTLKTSSLEGASTTVYATGGRGNSRLMGWEGERTVTFTMEDALISPAGFMILSGAGLIEASKTNKIVVHTTEQTNQTKLNSDKTLEIVLSDIPHIEDGSDAKSSDTHKDSADHCIYVMATNNGEVISEPYRAHVKYDSSGNPTKTIVLTLGEKDGNVDDLIPEFYTDCVVLVDYYVDKVSGAYEIDITPDKFGGNYYVEASTLFRNTNGVDMPAEFIIPNCKVQSNFTFSMASSGDPSTFTFTMDAFPDYTRFDKTKKVLAAIQVIDNGETNQNAYRDRTASSFSMNSQGQVIGANGNPVDFENITAEVPNASDTGMPDFE